MIFIVTITGMAIIIIIIKIMIIIVTIRNTISKTILIVSINIMP